MGNVDVLFNAAAFVAGLSLLERGADLFVDSASTLARRLRLPQVLVALLIAGAEWEELAVVIVSLAQKRPALAVGNVVGSTIANILGAFSLGLIFSTGSAVVWIDFDRSSKMVTAALLALTSLVSLFALAKILNRVVGALLIAMFFVYVVLVLWWIWRGISSPSEHDESDEDIEAGHDHLDDASSSSGSSSSSSSSSSGHSKHHDGSDEHTPLFSKLKSKLKGPKAREARQSSLSPILKLAMGFVALTISGFILSHTSENLAEAFDMSDTAFGATVLSLATSLPEKFIAITSGARGHSGLLVADAVGSNIFLLTICLGVAAVATPGGLEDHWDWHISRIEVWWMWAATVALLAVVAGGNSIAKVGVMRQLIGAGMLTAYGGFLAVEFLRDRY